MANFRIWKSVLTGRRHGQFSETCVHMAPAPRSLHVDTPAPIPAFASLCLHRLKVQVIIYKLEASDLIFEACIKPEAQRSPTLSV